MIKTALIVIDMVYDFAHPNGAVYYPQNGKILPKICHVIKECKKRDILIVFIQHYHRKFLFDKELHSDRRPNCIEGTGGETLMPELAYDPKQDYLVKKRRYNSFCGTDLDLILRENDISQLIIVGTKTNCCIRASVEGAYHLDYNVIVFSDCVATNDETTNHVHLTDISKYLGNVMISDDFFTKWEKKC